MKVTSKIESRNSRNNEILKITATRITEILKTIGRTGMIGEH